MNIGIIQASSQVGKNKLIFDTVKKYAAGSEIINFGCTEDEPNRYSYIEISVLAGMLLSSGRYRMFFRPGDDACLQQLPGRSVRIRADPHGRLSFRPDQ